MAAPTFIQEAETTFDTTADKTTASFNVVTNDILVACAIRESDGTLSVLNIADSQTPDLTWTKRQEVLVSGFTTATIWTATADFTGSMTVTLSDTEAGQKHGLNVLTFRSSDGVGASSKTNVDGEAPTLDITTTQANSAIVVVNGDWNAADGTTRTWRANAGALTEQSYFRNASNYTIYIGYHADSGAVATYAVGLSAPAGQKYSIAACEIKGTAAAASLPKRSIIVNQAVNRSSTF